MNIIFSPADWIWAVPMGGLYLVGVIAFLDGLLLAPMSRGPDPRAVLLGEVQRCCIVTGFLGTLIGVYQVLQSLSGSAIEQMFSGMGSAITSSIAGCVLYLGAFFCEQLILLRWSRRKVQPHPYRAETT